MAYMLCLLCCPLNIPHSVLYCKYVHYVFKRQILQEKISAQNVFNSCVIIMTTSMARKSKKKESSFDTDSLSVFRITSRETSNTILGILSLVISIFLLLGAFASAGRVGTVTYEILSYLFGV